MELVIKISEEEFESIRRGKADVGKLRYLILKRRYK